MNILNTYLTEVLTASGLSGIRLDIAASVLLSLAVMLFAIVVGRFIEILDEWLIRVTARATGFSVARFILNRAMFMGTVFHECSHALAAILTGANVVKMCCFTLFSKTKLGYVEFETVGGRVKRSLQLSMVSCAPVLTGFITVPLFANLAVSASSWVLRIVFGWIALSILCHMSMSKADVQMYVKGAIVVLPLLSMIVFIVRYVMGLH